MALDETVRSPDWWLIRLGRRLRDKRRQLTTWRSYWRGDHPLPEAPRKDQAAYRQFLKMSRTNFCALVVRADVHRLKVIGVSDSDGHADDVAWFWWQANKLDARQKQIYRTASGLGEAFVMVGPDPRGRVDGEGRPVPLITAEHPLEVLVEDDPATGVRVAGLKAWYDDIDRRGYANIYLPDVVVRYRTVQPRGPGELPWDSSSWEPTEEVVNPIGDVPIVPFRYMPDLGEAPEPAFATGIDVQNRVNLSMLNRISAERYSAFRQKYVIGHQFKTKIDPMTGLEVPEQVFEPGPDKVWVSGGDATKVKFGEFSQTELMGFLKSHESDVRDFLVLTSTPAYYVASELVNLSADAVNALDTSHVAKIQELATNHGESLEDMLGLASKVAGDPRDFTSSEVRWQDPRNLNPALLADMATKKKSIGFPLAMIAEDLGESPQRISRLRAETASDALLASLTVPVG